MKKFLCLFLVLGVASTASAWIDVTWDGGASTTSFLDADNWDTDAVPVSTDAALISNDAVDLAGNAAVTAIYIGRLGGTGSLTMASGTFDVGAFFAIGEETGDTGTFTMNGGTVNVLNTSEYMAVGRRGTGTLNMNGGTMNLTGLYIVAKSNGDGGHAELSGGVINAGYLASGLPSVSSLNMTAGTLVLDGDITSMPSWATAYGGSGSFIFNYDGSTATTITAIPEPATIALLGLGGLALIRKKR